MFSKKEILKRSLAGLMTAAIVLTGVQTPVQADNLQDEVTLHAGATAVMNGAYTEETEQKTDNADLQAGAALYLEKDGEELAEAVTEVDAGAIVEKAAEAEKASDVVMANVSDAVNVRVEPSEEAEVAGKLYKNCGGTILEQADGWTKLTSGELTGWTKDEFLLFGDEAEAMQQEVGSLKATVKTDALRVRKEASEDAGIYTVLALGESVTAVEETDGWVTVQVDEDTRQPNRLKRKRKKKKKRS